MAGNSEEYIPALRFRALTPFYDLVQRLFVRDVVYKKRLIDQARIQPGQHVLDLGCGTGTLAIMVKQAEPKAEVTGLDADPQMLGVARAKAVERAATVTFDQGMANALPYPDAAFDRVLSSLMIHHLKTADKGKTARELYRILKAGGQLHVVDFGKPQTLYGKLLKPFLHEFEEVNDNIDGRLSGIFESAGFKVRELGNYSTFFGELTFYFGEKH
jgi:ubiquinone/menaquinone biosynthesis C-methylase UbiE